MRDVPAFSFLAVPGTVAAFRILSLRFTPGGNRMMSRASFAVTAAVGLSVACGGDKKPAENVTPPPTPSAAAGPADAGAGDAGKKPAGKGGGTGKGGGKGK